MRRDGNGVEINGEYLYIIKNNKIIIAVGTVVLRTSLAHIVD